ncbi:unnamed protein product, partial [Chrysoparadoxa australica]
PPPKWDDAIAGVAAGGVSRILTAPFDMAKIRYQLDHGREGWKYKNHGLLKILSSIYSEEGMVSLWRGNMPAMALWMSYSGAQFGVYGQLKRLLGKEENWSHPHAFKFACGSVAGAAATFVTYPFDVARTALAYQGIPKRYSNFGDFASKTFRKAGIRGFFAGLSPALLQIAPQMGFSFTIYEWVTSLLIEVVTVRPIIDAWPVLAGVVAGTCSKLLVYPFDTVKKRVQVQVMHRRSMLYGPTPLYGGPLHALAAIYTQEGVMALFKGIVPAMYKSGISTALTFGVYEVALSV